MRLTHGGGWGVRSVEELSGETGGTRRGAVCYQQPTM